MRRVKIIMKYFASLREILGKTEEVLEVPPGTDVERLRDLLVEKHPDLRDIMGTTLPIVNTAYVTGERALEDRDEVAFIPPVSGG
jgi:molybdopterin converting factor subunit 1